MKPAAILFGAPALLAQVMGAPAGSVNPNEYRSSENPPTLSGRSSVLEVLKERDGPYSHLDTRCSFWDGHGNVPCDMFSVTWGPQGTVVTVQGEVFKKSVNLDCKNRAEFQEITSPLPFVVLVSPGNTCRSVFGHEAFDGVHIKYANQYFNTPTDTRCQRVATRNMGMRCLIPLRP